MAPSTIHPTMGVGKRRGSIGRGDHRRGILSATERGAIGRHLVAVRSALFEITLAPRSPCTVYLFRNST